MKKHLVLVLSLLSFLACSDGADRGPREADSERFGGRSGITDAPSAQCSNQDETTADDSMRVGGELTGDVDGDAQPDAASLSFDENGEVGCQAFLEVTFDDASVVVPIWVIGPQGGLPMPRLHGLAQIDGVGGVEVLVDEVAGASTQFVAAYTYAEGSIEQINPPGLAEGLFPYGGSVGHIEAADCAAAGDIVVSEAVPAAGRSALRKGLYDITRRFFSASQAGYVRDHVEHHRRVPLDNLDRFDEFGSGPFGNCPAP